MSRVGPGVLRVGGNSVDMDTALVLDGSDPPEWASNVVGASDLAGLRALADAADWDVILDLTLGHYDPNTAATNARIAKEILGPRLAGVEIGNEPDDYVSKGLRPAGWSFQEYRAEVDAYINAISEQAPDVSVIGPGISDLANLDWSSPFANGTGASALSAHYYPLASCQSSPTIGDLLSPETVDSETSALTSVATRARAMDLPVRLTETNSMWCGGEPGVSNAQASALWTTGYLLRALDAGVDGVNFHDSFADCSGYSALCTGSESDAAGGNVSTNPQWLALELFSQLRGNRLARTTTTQSGVTTAVFIGQKGTRQLVIVNPQGESQHIRAFVGRGYRRAAVSRIMAPDLSSVGQSRLVAQKGNAGAPAPRVSKLEIPPASVTLVSWSRR